MRFCQSFANELSKLIGDVKDVPAGDIGVGARKIGYIYGQYKKQTGRFDGALTGKKGLSQGGSLGRTEATGYGCVYFAIEMLKTKKDDLSGKKCVISGAENGNLHSLKLYEYGAFSITMSDSTGYIYDKNGIDLELLKELVYMSMQR